MSGPRFPSALKRELDVVNPNPNCDGKSDELIPVEDGSRKIRRYNSFDNLEYELGQISENDNMQRVDDGDGDFEWNNRRYNSDQSRDELEGDCKTRLANYVMMLQGITGMAAETKEDKKTEKNIGVSEFTKEIMIERAQERIVKDRTQSELATAKENKAKAICHCLLDENKASAICPFLLDIVNATNVIDDEDNEWHC